MSKHRAYKSVACDVCNAPSDAIHLWPYISANLTVRCSCPDHDPGGYWFYIDRWATGPDDWHRPGRVYTTRQHLLTTKLHGQSAVWLIEQRLPRWLTAKARRA